MRHAIIVFQFYDMLTQRLSHLSNSMGSLGELISDTKKLYSPYAWRGLQEQIKSKYTMESDRKMFEAIVNGYTVKDALSIAENSVLAKSKEESDVELF